MFLLALAASTAVAASARAQFLVDPAGGTVISTPSATPQAHHRVYAARPLGFSMSFYGTTHTTVDVCDNGFISFTGNSAFTNSGLPTNVARICGMWDDLFLYAGQTIVEKTEPGVFYSATWTVGTIFFGHVQHRFQIVIFGADKTLYGIPFHANDIVLSYAARASSPYDGTIGLDKGDGIAFDPIPGDADGHITDAQASLLPVLGESGRVILFRPDGAGGYDATIFPCPADANRNGEVSVQDIFDFLAIYFAGCP